ncbi:POM121-like protein 12 [Microtus ochrogaster]|uniref:POM121-like protein 12 n=1 Tax=Microtus ochrogaster TaxID=79684 RepID=A0ABM0LTI5_MICOH|nr:POM121-like protein 12 [Microtus ochrogaster]
MGSSLGSPQRSLPAPAPRSRPRSSWIQPSPGPKIQQNLHKPQRVAGTWRRSSIRLPADAARDLDLSSACMKQLLWSLHKPGWTSSSVTVKIALPESRASALNSLGNGTHSAEGPEKSPDPCAKETVLKALSQCKKGRRRFDGPLWFEVPEVKNSRQNPESRPSSAFKPCIKNGVAVSFVPKPGRLNQSPNIYKMNTDLKTSIHAAMPAVSEPHVESWEKTQASCDPSLTPVPKRGALGVTLVGRDFQPTMSSDC